ncbi:MAG: hypothetical protein NVS3B19_06830 [Ginsengibacter sp.]
MKGFISTLTFLLLLSLFLFSFINGKKPATRSATRVNKTSSGSLKERKENPYYIIINKSKYELQVFDDEGWYATYPVVFGSTDLSDKMVAGDKRTPEGKFKVILKKIHPKWAFELLLDYPNQESVRKFTDRMNKGIIPKNAKLGNGIAIHATRPSEEWTVDYFQNWTDGCVSLKYTEAKDLYSYIPIGTPVTIVR